jgi:exopolysaccharide biosynthesis polyprenyl glycosylphosphotransferase
MGASKASVARAADLVDDLPVPRPSAANVGDSRLRRLLATGDASAALVSLLLATTVFSDRRHPTHGLLWGLFAMPLVVLVFKLYGLYDRDVKRISHSTVDDLPWLLHAILIASLALWLYGRFTPLSRLDLAEIVTFGALLTIIDTTMRSVLRHQAAAIFGAEPALVVGGGEMVAVLAAKLAAHREYRLSVVGMLASGHHPPVVGLPLLGRLNQLEQIAVRVGAMRIIVSPRDIDESQLQELLRQCRKLSLKVSILPALSDVLGPAVAVDDVEGVTLLGINPPYLPRSSRVLKRLMDLVIVVFLLVPLAPLVVVLVLLVKLDSPGPAFFSQERVGRDGRRFRLYKLRTMVVDAEERHSELLSRSTDPDWLKLEGDPRITHVGRVLRRFSLDELPQLWNVLRGEMSLVGPRPLIEAEDERVAGWARDRLGLTPGLTGYWQVLGRTRISFEEMVKLDYLYVMNWSLWEDVRLMLRTLPAVLGGDGAN